jgi:hypothetical protein
MPKSGQKKKKTAKTTCQEVESLGCCSITKEEVFLFLKRAAESYDRLPSEGIHVDKLNQLADELLEKLN